jgi:hypothetical protein
MAYWVENGSGARPVKAFDLLSKARGMSVPDTPEQVEWVQHFETRHLNTGP